MRRDDERFVEFARTCRSSLRHTAYLLTADWHASDDLVQSTLIKVYVAWPKIRQEVPAAYARRVLLRAFLDGRRRRSSTEVATHVLADPIGPPEHDERRLDLLAALSALPDSQRAVVVLRFYQDLSVEQTADVLGVTQGTVKSQTSKATSHLREALGQRYLEETA